jgi:DNA polymerase-3 subunit gamma/tau
MLTREAWNALLKILEEPPPGVVFVFATTEPQKIAATAAPVLSRLQRFDFRRIGPGAIRARLREVLAQEQLGAEDDALALIARYADGGMRDALSVLDQCLSFGEGAITAALVRDVLGLIGDEQYAEVLRLTAEKDTAAVFPLVDALVNAGADLAEFMTGTADMMRAVLMVQSGAVPEGLTDAMRAAIERHRDALPAADVVRMLGLLADSEAAIRRSASARLVVETLLLRWTLMDRIVEIEAMLRGAPSAGASGRPAPREPAQPPSSKPSPTRASPSPSPEPVPPAATPRPAGERQPLALPALLEAWPDIRAAASERSKLLGQALDGVTPVSAGDGVVRLSSSPDHGVLVEGVQRQLPLVEELIGLRFEGPVKVKLVAEAPPPGRAEPPQRMTNEVLRAERLARLRRIDPALDTAANELDLEIVDEG